MAGFGGFNFGKTTTATTTGTSTQTGGFSFGGTGTAATPSGGFGFGTLGSTAQQATASAPGFAVPSGTSGLFGTPPTASAGLSLAQPSSSSVILGTTPATTSVFSLGGTAPAATSAFSLSGTTTGTTGFSLGSTTGGTSGLTSGFSLGGTTSAGATSSTTPLFGFSRPLQATTTTSSGLSFGGSLKLGTTTTTSALSLGGFGGFGATSTSTTGGSIFGQGVAKATSTGLGGVDPKTTTSAATDSGKPGDSKTVKETPVENHILLDVDELRKFVKEEKSEMEQMKRMSSTPMMKVQEENAALRQLLSVVSSGLQKNVCAVDKLKKEMSQELKNAEMAIRTKETPAGLQYENTSPILYFQSVIENFETQMLTYRQQIELLENHLASLHQPNRLTSDELILLLRKLHEAFVAMAAQLQQIHEAVKTQKEHYLNYRKVFHGDTRNIFECQKKAPVKVTPRMHTDMYGHSPFPGINNAAAVAMASALTRTQQPQNTAGAPPVSGFSSFQSSSGFGSTSAGFGTGSTGTSGFGTSSSLFGNTSNLATTSSLFSSTGLAPGLGLSTSTDKPFQLNKPPAGTKRNKR